MTQDPNQAFYVIAYAVVEMETKETWKWFSTRLFEDICYPNKHGWEVISDMQKVLLPAVQELCPGTRHRFYVKYLEANFWSQWRNQELIGLLWDCAFSKTTNEFNPYLQKIKEVNEEAWIYLKKFELHNLIRAAFSPSTKNPVLVNNVSKQFNAAITKFRWKPIITMLESIREYLTVKMNNYRREIESYHGPIIPAAQTKLEDAKKHASKWHPMWVGDLGGSMFQVLHICSPKKQPDNCEPTPTQASNTSSTLTSILCLSAILCSCPNAKNYTYLRANACSCPKVNDWWSCSRVSSSTISSSKDD
ncbi:hypothetical protein CRG98_035447 [Punica granatum]|uniref:MULE transposase domain-containing protein n=1 Tax=Punica granatum TaxID=22663 RepID=A0A2I0IJJ1_PUNGR|nr:hypothetical protein CRG98_035447 [Punica granatum]